MNLGQDAYLTRTINAVMRSLDLLSLRHILCDLIEIRCSRQIQNYISCNLLKASEKLFQTVGLHGLEIEDSIVFVSRS